MVYLKQILAISIMGGSMKKHIKGLMIFFAVILSVTCFSKNASAKEDLYITDWIVNASLKENGDLEISEDITFEFNKKYNGVYRDIVIDESYDVSDIKVKEVTSYSRIDYVSVDKAKNGDKEVFTTEKKNNKVIIKIFSPSKNETKTFRISYVVKNAAIRYNDTGELYYKFLGEDNKTPIGYFAVYINLPYKYDSYMVRVFVHGPYNGTINKIDSGMLLYLLQAKNVPPKTFFEGRLLFPPEYIAESTNFQNIDRYQEIIDEEEAIRQKKEQNIKRKENTKNLLNKITLYVSGISIIVFAVILYQCRRKVDREILMREYKDIPEDCTPAVAAIIAGLNLDSNMFFATVLDLFRKGYLRIKGKNENINLSKNNDFIIYKVRNEDLSLLEHERYFMNWLFNDMGNGESVSTMDIKKFSKHNEQKFYQSLKNWKSIIKKEAKNRGYIDNSKNIQGSIIVVLSIICIILGIVTTIYESIYALLNFAVGITLLIYGIYLLCRLSDKGYIQYIKWKNFLKYMKAHNPDLSSEDALNSLDKSLIYALVFGVLKDQIFDDSLEMNETNDWIIWYILFADSSNNSFSRSINDSFAESSSASNGSFSDGGGGIGGGGAGGF